MKCCICGQEIGAEPVVPLDQNIAHRFWTTCKRVVEDLRQRLADQQRIIDAFLTGSDRE